MKKKILIFNFDNENLKNFESIIKHGKDKFEFTFFDLSNFHKNNINYSDTSIKKISSDIKMNKPFYLLSSLRKIYFYFLFRKELKNIKEKYDIIISGRIGLLEYAIIKYFKKISYITKSYSINDSILIYHEQNSIFKKIRLIIYGFQVRQNICDKIFVSGEISKKTLIKDGVNEDKILISGLPRFKKYFDKSFKLNNQNDDNKVLILTGAHKWNGYNSWQKDQEDFLLHLDSLYIKDYNINIKPHPRDNFNFGKLEKLNILSKEIDIDTAIANHDIIVCATSLSTALIQAGLLGKKTLFIKTRNLSYLMESYDFYISNFPSVSKNTFDENSFSKANKNDSDILDKFISKKSLYSSEIILDEVTK